MSCIASRKKHAKYLLLQSWRWKVLPIGFGKDPQSFVAYLSTEGIAVFPYLVRISNISGMNRLLLLFFVCFTFLLRVSAQQKTNAAAIQEKMQWFADARLGIFIHTGIYAVNGVDESWSFYNKKISYADYMQQLKGFTLKQYDPAYWADLIQESGARYAVVTTKHHDGVAMYDTKMNDLSIVKASPAQRDMVQPLFRELHKRQIKCGAYFSLLDWSHPDYPNFIKGSPRYKVEAQPEKWKRFRAFFQGQIKEIGTKFNPDLWWFDGDWEQSPEQWESVKLRSMILAQNPKTIINGRMKGFGDYDTPEQNAPVSRPSFRWWELCMTINNNWGYQPQDTAWKTPYEVISIFVDAVSKGGNLLLNIGPKADGTIPEKQVEVLKALGKWNAKHGEAVFGTLGGLPEGHFYGPSTLSKDSTTLYLFLPANTSGSVMIKGLNNAIRQIEVVGNGTKLSHKIVGKISWSKVPGLVFIQVPPTVQDEYVTVLKLQLDAPVKLYRGKGGLTAD